MGAGRPEEVRLVHDPRALRSVECCSGLGNHLPVVRLGSSHVHKNEDGARCLGVVVLIALVLFSIPSTNN